MPSEASVAIEEAKLRLALAERWNRSAEVQLESAKANFSIAQSQVISSQNEVDEAKMHLKSVEEKYEVIDVDDSFLSSKEDEAKDEAKVANVISTTAPNDASMEIYIRFYGGRTVALNVIPSHTVENVKDMLYERLKGCYSTCMRYAGKHLENSSRLSIYNIQDGDTLHLDSPYC